MENKGEVLGNIYKSKIFTLKAMVLLTLSISTGLFLVLLSSNLSLNLNRVDLNLFCKIILMKLEFRDDKFSQKELTKTGSEYSGIIGLGNTRNSNLLFYQDSTLLKDYSYLANLNLKSGLEYLKDGKETIAFDKFEEVRKAAQKHHDIDMEKKLYFELKEHFREVKDVERYELYAEKYINLLQKNEGGHEASPHFYQLGIVVLGLIALLVYLFFPIIRKNIESKKNNVRNIKNVELLQLASTDPLAFYKEFNTSYPNFNQRLLSTAPDLTLLDLETLYYMFYSFGTKDIASYTNCSVRAIETRKYRIRKKLNMQGDKEIILWLND